MGNSNCVRLACRGTVHCVSPLQQLTLLEGSADTSVDMFSFAAKYSTGAPVAALEPYKK